MGLLEYAGQALLGLVRLMHEVLSLLVYVDDQRLSFGRRLHAENLPRSGGVRGRQTVAFSAGK